MAVSGARAANFIRGGTSSSIFAAKRGMTVARPARPVVAEGDPQAGSRFGKASGGDYVRFFSGKRSTKALRSAIVNLKSMLVEGFTAAKSLQASVGNIVGQLKGVGGGKKFGLFGIVAAVAIAVGAFFAPQLKAAFEYVFNQAKNIFKTVRAALRSVDERIQAIYKGVQDFVGGIRNWISGVNNNIRFVSKAIKDLYSLFRQGHRAPELPELPNIPDNILPDYKGLDFLKEEYGMDNLKSDVGGAFDGMFGGMFGGIQDMLKNTFGGLFGNPEQPKVTDPGAPNTGTGRDGTFGEGTYGQGRPTDGSTVSAPGDLKTRIRQAESGNDYGSMYARNRDTFSRGNEDITKMTIDQVHDLQTDYLNHQKALGYNSPDGSDRSAAMGAYQMMEVRQVAKEMGFDPSTTVFNKETQDKMAEYYLNVAGLQDYKAGRITAEQFNNRLAVQFASLKTTSGGGVHDGDGMNNAYDSVLDLIKRGDIRGNNIVPQTQSRTNVQSKDPKVSFIQVPGQQVAQAPARPQRLINTGTPDGSASPTVAFYSPSNPDSFEQISAKAAYSLVG